jgi:hypothetical protein
VVSLDARALTTALAVFLSVGLVGGLVLGLGGAFQSIFDSPDEEQPDTPGVMSGWAFVLLLNFALFSVSFAILTFTAYDVQGISAPFFSLVVGGYLGLDTTLAIAVFAITVVVGHSLRSPFFELTRVGPYLRVMAPPLAGFSVVYFTVIVWFAGVMSVVNAASAPAAFSSGGRGTFGQLSFGEFVFFSMMTVPPLGYSDVRPTSPLAKAIVACESLIGTALFIFVVAALIAYLGPAFERLRTRNSGKRRS